MNDIINLLSPSALGNIDFSLWLAITILVTIAGIIKGITGFGFPMIMFSGMTLFFDPNYTIAYVALPSLVVNTIQSLQFGIKAAVLAARASIILSATLCISIFAAAPLVNAMPPTHLFAILGSIITALALTQLVGLRFNLPPQMHRKGAAIAGVAAGFCGGFAGIWAPFVVIYLLALNMEKNRQVLIQGVVYTIGSLVLIAAHFRTGIVNITTLYVSAALVLPSLIGLTIGSLVLSRLDQQAFRVCTLIVLIVAGLHLIWRALIP